jgi:hypothetical protein
MVGPDADAITLDPPDDPAIADALLDRLKSLPLKEGNAVSAVIQILEDLRVTNAGRSLRPEGVATFNRRFDVFVLEPNPGPNLIVVHDRQEDRFVLADICDHWPTVDYAIDKSALALGETATERSYWPRR